MKLIKNELHHFFFNDPSIYMEISKINIHRMFVMSWVIGLVNIVHIIIFWLNIPSEPTHIVQWYALIIFTHATMLFINIFLGIVAFRIEKKELFTSKFSYFMQCTAIVASLLFGVMLCVSDQLVTTNINPLILVCIGVGVIFLIPPISGLLLYAITFVLFYNLVTWTQPIPELLEHVRINSVSATMIGLAISWILWRNHLLRFRQKHIIEEQQRKLEEKNEYLQFLAMHDPLTGMLNRNSFIELVETEISRIKRTGREACLILLDIDYFKKINDRFGHPAGDKILKDTSNMILSTLRSSDIAARLGGEEFIILLPESNLGAGRKVADKLRTKIEEYAYVFEGNTIHVTASFGVAELKESFHTCYCEADKALYLAKDNGRNTIVLA